MFCPKCGASQTDELKFCNLCGANLYAVRQVVDTRETSEKFDWSKSWVTEMFLSNAERKRRVAQLKLQRGITPEVKRLNEIKGGVITSCVSIAATVFLFVLMQGIIQISDVTPDDVKILSRIWVAGIIPFMVGIGLIINGLFVSGRIARVIKEASPEMPDAFGGTSEPRSLRSPDTNGFSAPEFSVTELTTKHLGTSDRKD